MKQFARLCDQCK